MNSQVTTKTSLLTMRSAVASSFTGFVRIPSIQSQGNPPWVEIDQQKPLGSTFDVATDEVRVKIVELSV
jgi:hypothetical protein